jgi:hypothetical protein
MTLPSITVELSGSAFSDLFFNHEHPNIDAFYASNMDAGATDGQYRKMLLAAIKADAVDFLSLLNPEIAVSAEQLAENFLSRL